MAPNLSPLPRNDAGFTLVEMLVAVAVSAVGLFLFVGFYPPAMDTIQGDAAMRVLYWQLKLGRETAINQRAPRHRGAVPAAQPRRPGAPRDPRGRNGDLDDGLRESS
jgi:prepilin-type N-terminal cleavage/methylation domain-containing protein